MISHRYLSTLVLDRTPSGIDHQTSLRGKDSTMHWQVAVETLEKKAEPTLISGGSSKKTKNTTTYSLLQNWCHALDLGPWETKLNVATVNYFRWWDHIFLLERYLFSYNDSLLGAMVFKLLDSVGINILQMLLNHLYFIFSYASTVIYIPVI